jgi:16S rRNA (guanine966-N2)-methyltransferase
VQRLDQMAYDIAFVDPPYGSRKLDRVVERWLAQPFCRILCVEHDPDYAMPLDGQLIVAGESAVTIVQ